MQERKQGFNNFIWHDWGTSFATKNNVHVDNLVTHGRYQRLDANSRVNSGPLCLSWNFNKHDNLQVSMLHGVPRTSPCMGLSTSGTMFCEHSRKAPAKKMHASV